MTFHNVAPTCTTRHLPFCCGMAVHGMGSGRVSGSAFSIQGICELISEQAYVTGIFD